MNKNKNKFSKVLLITAGIAHGLLLVLLLFLSLFLVSLVEAKTVYPTGPFFEGPEKLIIAADAGYNQARLVFSPGETVYLKVESNLLIDANANNIIEVYDFSRNLILSTQFSQTSFTSPYVYQASFVFPAQSTYFKLLINLRSSQSERFNIEQTLETLAINQYFRLYKDANHTQEHYVFKSSDTAYLLVYGNLYGSKQDSQTILNFQSSGIYYGSSKFSQNNNWYSLTLNLGTISGFVNQYWYVMKAESRFGSRLNFDASRMFFIDNTQPTAEITFPSNNSQITGIVEIRGSADDASFDYYRLEYENQADLGTWIAINSNYTVPVNNDILGQWDTGLLSSGTYNLRLTVVDLAGNQNVSLINGLIKPAYTGEFSLTAPELALLSSVSVSTLVEESYGVIGDASGDNDIEVIDDRGTFDGWTLTMTMTDFFSTSSIIPATSMTITPTSVNVKSGLADGVSAGVVHTFLSDTDPATVMLAADGYGNGNYWNDVDLLLLVPGLTKAGFYSAVVTFSLQ